jgi:DNA-directed RNA polymerase beta subunit
MEFDSRQGSCCDSGYRCLYSFFLDLSHQIYMASPTFAELDGKVGTLFPADARLRNLTYAANLYIDATVVYVPQDTHTFK